MNCRKTQELITAKENRSRLEDHLYSCPSCRKAAESFRLMDDLFHQQARMADGAELSPWFDSRFHARLQREMEAAPALIPLWGRAMVATAAVCLLAVLIVRGPFRSHPAAPADAQSISLLTACLSSVPGEVDQQAEDQARKLLNYAL
jgi:hypothetical protein